MKISLLFLGRVVFVFFSTNLYISLYHRILKKQGLFEILRYSWFLAARVAVLTNVQIKIRRIKDKLGFIGVLEKDGAGALPQTPRPFGKTRSLRDLGQQIGWSAEHRLSLTQPRFIAFDQNFPNEFLRTRAKKLKMTTAIIVRKFLRSFFQKATSPVNLSPR